MTSTSHDYFVLFVCHPKCCVTSKFHSIGFFCKIKPDRVENVLFLLPADAILRQFIFDALLNECPSFGAKFIL